MKFLNKYELMEPVTGGAVETFVARDLASGERVIVHMFAGSEVLPDNPALQWALQSLRGLAPTPMGSVIEGGRYEQTSHAYLVTKFPADPVALQHWIRFYTMQSESTQPTLNTPVPDSSAKTQFSSALEKPKQPVGEFTKAFFGSATADVDSQPSSGSGKAPQQKLIPDPADNWSRKPAGAFTKEFLSGFGLEAEIKKASPPASATKEPKKPQSFTAEFLMAGSEARAAEEKPAVPKKDSISALFGTQAPTNSPLSTASEGKQPGGDVLDFSAPAGNASTGEFTKFFRGPFGGQSTSGAPAGMNAPSPRPRDKAGEFTQLFGPAAKSPPLNESGALLEPAASKQSGNFTEVFGSVRTGGDNQAEASRSTPSSGENEIDWNQPAPSQPPRPDSSFVGEAHDRTATFREPGAPPNGSISSRSVGESTALFANEIAWDRPAPPRAAGSGTGSAEPIPRSSSPTALQQVTASSGATKSGATSVFTPPGGPSAAPPVPSGPSEYTRIISPPNPAPPEEAKPAPPTGPAGPAFSFPQVAVPPLAMPKAPTPAMPQVQAPQPPHLQYPHLPQPMPMQVSVPAMQAPQAPAAPQAPQASAATATPQKFPYWPLIIVMNVLLIVAVALILYFALKH